MALEFAASGILGSVFGGLFRLAPEVLKFLDRKDDRKHELAMYGLQIDLEKTKGQTRVDEKYVDYGIAQTQAIQSAFESQSKEASASYRWVSALSALVRPTVTYILFLMYVAFKITIIVHAINSGANWIDIARNHWTVEDFTMLNMILTFWFLGRSIEKRNIP